jgi:hypothetical protein
LLDAVYPDSRPRIVPEPDPRTAAKLREYAGKYISSLSCRSCADAEEQTFDVTAEADGMLKLWGQTWIPYGRDLFVRADGKRLLGFARNRLGRVISVSAGSWRVADRPLDRPTVGDVN